MANTHLVELNYSLDALGYHVLVNTRVKPKAKHRIYLSQDDIFKKKFPLTASLPNHPRV